MYAVVVIAGVEVVVKFKSMDAVVVVIEVVVVVFDVVCASSRQEMTHLAPLADFFLSDLNLKQTKRLSIKMP